MGCCYQELGRQIQIVDRRGIFHESRSSQVQVLQAGLAAPRVRMALSKREHETVWLFFGSIVLGWGGCP